LGVGRRLGGREEKVGGGGGKLRPRGGGLRFFGGCEGGCIGGCFADGYVWGVGTCAGGLCSVGVGSRGGLVLLVVLCVDGLGCRLMLLSFFVLMAVLFLFSASRCCLVMFIIL
jgi:hypothetical protein